MEKMMLTNQGIYSERHDRRSDKKISHGQTSDEEVGGRL